MSVLFLMVGRGGSKGVPGKNLKKIGGLSLIGWKARAAHAVMAELERGENNCRLVISTDCPEIQEEARRHGVEVPFTRPPELATDNAPSSLVIQHALQTLGQEYTTVCLLEPSAPFATHNHILDAFYMYCTKEAHLVVGMKHTEPHSSFIGEELEDKFITPIVIKMNNYGQDTRRQARKQEWTMNGALYIFSSALFWDDVFIYPHDTRSIYNGARNYGYLMDHWHSIEIDSPRDLEMAEYAVANGYVEVPKLVTISQKVVSLFK